jgi:hypothetical protein
VDFLAVVICPGAEASWCEWWIDVCEPELLRS